MLVEAAAALRRKVADQELSAVTGTAALRSLGDAAREGTIRLADDEQLVTEAFLLAVELGHKVPDCIYLALAEREGCALATERPSPCLVRSSPPHSRHRRRDRRQGRPHEMSSRRVLMAIGVLLCRPPCSASAHDAIRSELDRVRTSLLAIQQEAPRELRWETGSRRVLALYERAWRLVGTWTARRLHQRPGTARELEDAVASLTTPDARDCLEKAYEEVRMDLLRAEQPRLAEYPAFAWCLGFQVRALGLVRSGRAPFAVAVTFGDLGSSSSCPPVVFA